MFLIVIFYCKRKPVPERFTCSSKTCLPLFSSVVFASKKDAIRFAMDYIEENKHICNCAFDALGREELNQFFK